MSTTDPAAHEAEVHDDHEAHDDHPSDWIYVRIAILLAVLTAIEVFTYFESVHQMSDNALIAILSILMVLKFFLVGAYFMHLKYDSPILRQTFMVGIAFALGVYCIMLLMFNFWF